MKNKKWPSLNLRELIDFIKVNTTGDLTLMSISKQTGVSQQAVSRQLLSDDIRLAVLFKVAECYNHRCLIEFIPIAETPVSFIGSSYQGIQGIRKCIDDRHHTIHGIAIRTGLPYKTLRKALVCGSDIRLSYVRRLAESLHLRMELSFIPRSGS